jgi:large subunit ribosomal protein L29
MKKDLKELSQEELQKLLLEKRKELFSLRQKVTLGKIKDVKQIMKTKREIARILTFLNQKRLKK